MHLLSSARSPLVPHLLPLHSLFFRSFHVDFSFDAAHLGGILLVFLCLTFGLFAREELVVLSKFSDCSFAFFLVHGFEFG